MSCGQPLRKLLVSKSNTPSLQFNRSKFMSKPSEKLSLSMCFVMKSLSTQAIVLSLPNCTCESVEADVLGGYYPYRLSRNRELTPSARSRCWLPPDIGLHQYLLWGEKLMVQRQVVPFQCLMLPKPTLTPLSSKDSFDSFLYTSLALHCSHVDFWDNWWMSLRPSSS